MADICRRGHWEHLPEALRELEHVRGLLDRAAWPVSGGYRQAGRDVSDALGKVREAAMAEMSKGLCR